MSGIEIGLSKTINAFSKFLNGIYTNSQKILNDTYKDINNKINKAKFHFENNEITKSNEIMQEIVFMFFNNVNTYAVKNSSFENHFENVMSNIREFYLN